MSSGSRSGRLGWSGCSQTMYHLSPHHIIIIQGACQIAAALFCLTNTRWVLWHGIELWTTILIIAEISNNDDGYNHEYNCDQQLCRAHVRVHFHVLPSNDHALKEMLPPPLMYGGIILLFMPSFPSDSVIRTVYYKYFHPKEALISNGILNRYVRVVVHIHCTCMQCTNTYYTVLTTTLFDREINRAAGKTVPGTQTDSFSASMQWVVLSPLSPGNIPSFIKKFLHLLHVRNLPPLASFKWAPRDLSPVCASFWWI